MSGIKRLETPRYGQKNKILSRTGRNKC